ncbi:MAG: Hsp33 family molecular chaperone HslO [Porticoccaceae bacterium]|nr:Hsp33 family molecular chaperone HslO [Porticoccaceae bacterium]MBT4591640.1 Hsp33 family molecular chaperone HslO [Porticoccaceae bacterium]MBT6027632.1 Hsp33 family molecular chaperone HslO [Porticoccaceae bacterium]MBT6422672.1 Hsp33 family molecular chaperone HslO [Porticoccaceae bacterium]MBT6691907.1 Hsp33 family molecular chaperone HslO [Porticoccaceae bacterium]
MKDQDTLQRFLFDGTDTRGEITTLASSYQKMVVSKNYPTSVALLFGEFLAAASLLSSSLKYPGIVSIQASGNGPISMIMAECSQGQQLRGIVRGHFEDLTSKQWSERQGVSALLHKSTLAITVEPENSERYQGIVPIESDNLSDCLEYYFEQSVQLPTKIRLASNETCAAGILIQQIPSSQTMTEQQHEWQHLCTLFATIKSGEQLELSHNDQLYRLFNEENVRLFKAQRLSFFCSCSRHRTEQALVSLGIEELLETCKEQGQVLITCQFCAEKYEFTKDQVTTMFNPSTGLLH